MFRSLLFTAIFMMTSMLHPLPIAHLEANNQNQELRFLNAGCKVKKCHRSEKKQLRAAQTLCRAIKKGNFTIDNILMFKELIAQIQMVQDQIARGENPPDINHAFLFNDTAREFQAGIQQLVPFTNEVSISGITNNNGLSFTVSRGGLYEVDWSFFYIPTSPQSGAEVVAGIFTGGQAEPQVKVTVGTQPIRLAASKFLTLQAGQTVAVFVQVPSGASASSNNSTISITQVLSRSP